MLLVMHLMGSGTAELIATIWGAAMVTISTITPAITVLYRRLRPRKQQDARRDDVAAQPQASPPTRHLYAHRDPSHVPVVAQQGRISAPIRIFRDRTPKLTAGQEADLIERGMPEKLVRNGSLDYASLTSGSMADRIRSGCC
jgi:hypothetical protein